MICTKNAKLFIPGWNIRAEIFEIYIPNAIYFTPPKATTDKPYNEAVAALGISIQRGRRVSCDARCIETPASLDDQRFHIIGWSMGGQIALLFAAQYPELVTSLTLLSTAAIFSRKTEDKTAFMTLCEIDFPRAIKYFHRLMGNINTDQSIELKKQFINHQNNALAYLQELHTRDLTDIAKQIKCPVKIVHATDDQIIPYSEAKYLKTLIPQANLITFQGNQHFPLFYDKMPPLL